MADEKNEHVEIECPHCHKKFWHKLGDAVKKAASVVIDVVQTAGSGGEPGVPR